MQEAPATGQTALCEQRRAEQAAWLGCEVPVCPGAAWPGHSHTCHLRVPSTQ